MRHAPRDDFGLARSRTGDALNTTADVFDRLALYP